MKFSTFIDTIEFFGTISLIYVIGYCVFHFIKFLVWMNKRRKRHNYIIERNKELDQNIKDFYINQEILDKDKKVCKITNISGNSIEVYIKKKKVEGINHKEWFYIGDFNKRFKAA